MSTSISPEGFHALTPYFILPDVRGFMAFLQTVFEAETALAPMTRPDGSIMHAEMRIGNSMLMMGEPVGEHRAMPASMYVYVPDCDMTYSKAIDAGANSLMEPADQPHGDRYGGVEDPFGNRWYIAQHLRTVTEAEYRSEYEQAAGSGDTKETDSVPTD